MGIYKVNLMLKIFHLHLLPNGTQNWTSHNNLNGKKMFVLPFKVTKEISLRWLQVRINHRILGTNYYLSKMNLVVSDRCTFCREHIETIKHIFWECEQVEYFWNSFTTILHDNCGLEDVEFNAVSIIFGNQKFDKLLNELILLGKRFIFRMKMKRKCLL